jgi:hypothetical protein
VTSPTSSSSWETGTNNNITWTSSNVVNVKIELYNGTSLSQSISTSTSSDGIYAWTVPTSVSAGDNYRIKITSTASSTVNAYSEYLSIT